jgi:gliding motility-associated-like protein
MNYTIVFIILYLLNNSLLSQEICDNGIDDDLDGLIDLNDPNCNCSNPTKTSIPVYNSNFEERNRCPTYPTNLTDCRYWVQGANRGTSDYFACGVNTISLVSDSITLPTNGTHSGQGFIGFFQGNYTNPPSYQEFVAQCLPNRLNKSNAKYRFKFRVGFVTGYYASPDLTSLDSVEIAFYGTKCSNVPFTIPQWNSSFCPSDYNDIDLIAKKTVGGYDEWVLDSVDVNIGENYEALIVGPGCEVKGISFSSNSSPYYLLDDIEIERINIIDSIIKISKQGNYCLNNQFLKINSAIDDTIQWYLDGVAIEGEYNYSIFIDTNIFKSGKIKCVVKKDGLCYESEEIDILEIRKCNPIDLYIPNTFTPNFDGINEEFKPTIYNSELVNNYTFSIFNKWGELIYSTNKLEDGWHGNFESSFSKTDLFIWKIQISVLNSPETITKYGHVSLIK